MPNSFLLGVRFCGYPPSAERARAEVAGSILVSHWGHWESEPDCTFEERMERGGHCIGDHDGSLIPRPGLPCHVPGKDIVVPPTTGDHMEGLHHDGPAVALDPMVGVHIFPG
jgi:hypothetical protein